MALVIAALVVIYYQFNPAKYGFFPRCPFYTITGFDCPGCGSQRAIYMLLHGNLKQAASYNFLLVISIPFLAVHFCYKLLSFVSQKDIKWDLLYHPLTPKIIFVVVMVFWIVRNVPVYPFNYLSAGH
ncbi:MAG TPA: DUF2752 domain-containing protein [Mucilaginibacter sp.]|jgi:hypothetical protein